MKMIHLPYHTGIIQSTIPPTTDCVIVEPRRAQSLEHPQLRLHDQLFDYLSELNVHSGYHNKTIAIAVNDNTRPISHGEILPVAIELLQHFGAKPEFIHIYIATGTHQPMGQPEIARMLPLPELKGVSVICHSCDDPSGLTRLGRTSMKTDVWVNRNYYLSDIKIVTGNIEPHHFMGYSGGVKTAAIGLAGRRTIEQNHAMLVHEKAIMGHYYDNPMRQDVEEIGDMIGIDLAINTINNNHHEIVEFVVGNPRTVMHQGIDLCKKHMQVSITQRDDLVIASAGGYPKDINLYQAQKAITHAVMFCKPGGVIILVAACGEGIGSERLESFMKDITNWTEAIDKFRSQSFEIGPHKAYQLAIQSQHAKIILVSDLSQEIVCRYFMEPASNLDEAIQRAKCLIGHNPSTVLLPYATHTMPFQERGSATLED